MSTPVLMQLMGVVFLLCGIIIITTGNLTGGLGMSFIGLANICLGWPV